MSAPSHIGSRQVRSDSESARLSEGRFGATSGPWLSAGNETFVGHCGASASRDHRNDGSRPVADPLSSDRGHSKNTPSLDRGPTDRMRGGSTLRSIGGGASFRGIVRRRS